MDEKKSEEIRTIQGGTEMKDILVEKRKYGYKQVTECVVKYKPGYVKFLQWLFEDDWEDLRDKLREKLFAQTMSEMALRKLGYRVRPNIRAKHWREGDFPGGPVESLYTLEKIAE